MTAVCHTCDSSVLTWKMHKWHCFLHAAPLASLLIFFMCNVDHYCATIFRVKPPQKDGKKESEKKWKLECLIRPLKQKKLKKKQNLFLGLLKIMRLPFPNIKAQNSHVLDGLNNLKHWVLRAKNKKHKNIKKQRKGSQKGWRVYK